MLNVTMDLRFTPYEMELFARLVWAEAIGEPEEGRIAVAASVLNRLADPRYPNTLEEVIMETVIVGDKVYYQYSPVLDGRIWELKLDRESDRKQYDIAMRAVYAAIAGQDPSLGATGFFNPDKVSPDPNLWVRQQPPTIKIGNHQFFLIVSAAVSAAAICPKGITEGHSCPSVCCLSIASYPELLVQTLAVQPILIREAVKFRYFLRLTYLF